MAGLVVWTALIVVLAGPETPHRAQIPKVDPGPAVTGVYAVPPASGNAANQDTGVYTPTAGTFPAPASFTLDVGRDVSRTAKAPIWAQSLEKAGRGRLAVQLLDHDRAVELGASGLLFTVTPERGAVGAVRVGVDYAAFAQAYGGNYGQRLRLVQLPSCALTSPRDATCGRATRLPSTNDPKGQRVFAPLNLPDTASVVLALTSTAAGDGGTAGSYAATSLKPSGSWSSGTNTGSFDYTYPIAVPPAPSALVPKLDLSYSSSSVDGQTASTQAQASWIGDGWSMANSYIEQSFTSCSDKPEGVAAPVAIDDECYAGPVLTLSLGGSSSALVWDATRAVWRPEHDNGEVISHVLNSGNGSGTYTTDYWTVVQRDGTTFQFGRNQLPGWTSGKPTTNSVDSEPVYFPKSTPNSCYNSDFSKSVCPMAYRWNVDYVKDTHGNAMAYYYKQDTNYYSSYNNTARRSYVRDSHLDHIDYGFRDGAAYATVPDQVVFNTAERCVTAPCTPLNAGTKANWPDVPFDLICSSGTSACDSSSPAYFSTVRLTSIVTQQYAPGPAQYQPVDTFGLAQSIPPTGDGLSPTLWLDSITNTGNDLSAGGSTSPITLSPVTFGKIALANRADTTNLPAFYRFRVASITTETGSVISPTYTLKDPCTAPITISPATNTSSCYPVYWTPDGYTQQTLDWFDKWVVTKVVQTDPFGRSPALSTSYDYLGGAAWHYDVNELGKAKYRTYGEFRGYGEVVTLTGDGANDRQAQTRATYYRGMSNNNNTTVVNVTDSFGGAHEDRDELSGKVLEKTAYRGKDGPVDSSTITSYWVSADTATRSRTGLPALTANWVDEARTLTRQAVTGTGPTTWRYTETDHSYNATVGDPGMGLVQYTYSHTVPTDPAFDQCVSYRYAQANLNANLVGLESEVESDSVACGGFTQGSPPSVPPALNALAAPTSVARPAQVVSVERTYYDDPSFGLTFPQPTAPTNGDRTMVREAVDYTGGAFTFQTNGRAVFDSVGRTTTSYDANDHATSTTYAINSVGLTVGSTITDPLQHATTTTFSPARGLALTTTDPNGVVVTQQHDALGRAKAVWLASRPVTAAANFLFDYQQTNTGVTAVTTRKMNDELGYVTTVQIFDALLRPRQTQTMTPQSGRLVTDTIYDSRGWTATRYDGWWDPATLPNTTLVSAVDLAQAVPSQHFFTYDGLGQVVRDDHAKNGVVISTTTSVRNGDRTTVIPPAGGVVRTTTVDPNGRLSKVEEYSATPTLVVPSDQFTGTWAVTGGTAVATTYGYDGHGNQATVTDASNATWTQTFDILGRVTKKTDPDAGQTNLRYDGVGNLIQSTDQRGKTVSYTYDATNRKTARFAATVEDQSFTNQTNSWVYDNANNAVPNMKFPIGHTTTSWSSWSGASYTTQVAGFNVFGQSTGETITIDAAEGALAGSYVFQHQYSTNTGLRLRDRYPAQGNLPAETVNYGYAGVLDLPNLVNGLAAYADSVQYDAYTRVLLEALGGQPNQALLKNQWDAHTGRLTEQLVTTSTTPPSDVDRQAYTYDLAGNLTRQVSTRLGAAAPSETQCFGYDKLDRLANAWTATDDCSATPADTNHGTVGDPLGSASAYWTTWQYDNLGNRTGQTQHSTTGGADVNTSYAYNGNSTGQPHTLTSTGFTGGSTGGSSYAYDAAGNMTSRNAGFGAQTLTWNEAGLLTKVAGSTGGDSTFIYNADDELLVQRDPGTRTLYLPGEQLVLNTSTNVVSGTRYYPLPGGGTGVRTGTATNSFLFELSDQHGTPTLYLDNTAQVPTWRLTTPFGAARGATGAWPDNHGFLNKPDNGTTGLVELGARGYDPATGRFISVDPVFVATDPQQLNGYAYGGNNPLLNADPSGQMYPADGGPPTVAEQNNLAKGGARNCRQNDSCVEPRQPIDRPAQAAPPPKPEPKKKTPWWKKGLKVLDCIGEIAEKVAPVLTLVAMVTAPFPPLDAFTATLATVVNVVATVHAAVHMVIDAVKGDWKSLAIDTVGAVGGVVGLRIGGLTGAFKGAGGLVRQSENAVRVAESGVARTETFYNEAKSSGVFNRSVKKTMDVWKTRGAAAKQVLNESLGTLGKWQSADKAYSFGGSVVMWGAGKFRKDEGACEALCGGGEE